MTPVQTIMREIFKFVTLGSHHFSHLIGTFGFRQQVLRQVFPSSVTVRNHQITRFVNGTFCSIKISIPLALRLLRNDQFSGYSFPLADLFKESLFPLLLLAKETRALPR